MCLGLLLKCFQRINGASVVVAQLQHGSSEAPPGAGAEGAAGGEAGGVAGHPQGGAAHGMGADPGPAGRPPRLRARPAPCAGRGHESAPKRLQAEEHLHSGTEGGHEARQEPDQRRKVTWRG